MLRSVDVARASISLTTRSGVAGRPRCFPRVQPPYPRAHPPVRPVRTRHGRSATPAQSAAASVRDGLVTTFYTYLQLTPLRVELACSQLVSRTAAPVQVFGRRHNKRWLALRRPAS